MKIMVIIIIIINKIIAFNVNLFALMQLVYLQSESKLVLFFFDHDLVKP